MAKKNNVSTLPTPPLFTSSGVGYISAPKSVESTQVRQLYQEILDQAFKKTVVVSQVYGGASALKTHTHTFTDLHNIKFKNLLIYLENPGGPDRSCRISVYVNGAFVRYVYADPTPSQYTDLPIFSDDLFRGTTITVDLVFQYEVAWGGTYTTGVSIEGYYLSDIIP